MALSTSNELHTPMFSECHPVNSPILLLDLQLMSQNLASSVVNYKHIQNCKPYQDVGYELEVINYLYLYLEHCRTINVYDIITFITS